MFFPRNTIRWLNTFLENFVLIWWWWLLQFLYYLWWLFLLSSSQKWYILHTSGWKKINNKSFFCKSTTSDCKRIFSILIKIKHHHTLHNLTFYFSCAMHYALCWDRLVGFVYASYFLNMNNWVSESDCANTVHLNMLR